MTNTGAPRLVALAGVPNVGKSSIFNNLTGLNQKVGNYPGITVDKKTGKLKGDNSQTQLVDLPGTYNLFPRSEDEQVVFRVLCGISRDLDVDAILVVADMSNLERGLFFATQLIDLGYPIALVLNMEDQAKKEGLKINKTLLQRLLGIPVYTTNAESRLGMQELKNGILAGNFKPGRQVVDAKGLCDQNMLIKVSGITEQNKPYRALQMLKFRNEESKIKPEVRQRLNDLAEEYDFDGPKAQRDETKLRYDYVRNLLSKCLQATEQKKAGFTRKLDAIFLHRVWGFAIFALILFLIFQAIFSWAEGPMDAIDALFAELSFGAKEYLPPGALTNLISEGIIPGLGGIVIFIPQIALLFAFLSILEASGYMARAVFITDRLMRPFGLNGRSVVPLISGFACAIPAIMAARNISNKKDRLITIFVTPFMSCSARLPVYIVLIGLIFPDDGSGAFNYRGLALFFMYLLGIAAALISAWALKLVMKRERPGSLVLELPRYRWPQPRMVLGTIYNKSKAFVVEAGKIILAISVILWVLASYGPGNNMQEAANSVQKPAATEKAALATYREEVSSRKLEASYAGEIGQWIEPVIEPLGYDWKIGIALVCSFAAREVFVSTVATLYSIGADSEDITTLQSLLSEEKDDDGSPMFTPPVVWSLLIFYAFAMQCMSTVAVVYRETRSIKWPLVQTVFMTVFAYVCAFATYQMLS